MRTARAGSIVAVGLAASLVVSGRAFATDFGVFKTKVKIVANMAIFRPNDPTDVIVTRKLGNNELINLALGRPLGTKVDSKTEVLATAITFEPPSNAPLAKIVVFDPSQNGIAQVKAIVMTGTQLDYDTAYLATKSQGEGSATGTIHDTVVGDFANNHLIATTLTGGGQGSGTHINPQIPGFDVTVSGKSTFSGRIKFAALEKGVPVTFDGFIVKGESKSSGKAIAFFSE
jgi:hypothetical protein